LLADPERLLNVAPFCGDEQSPARAPRERLKMDPSEPPGDGLGQGALARSVVAVETDDEAVGHS
jgi:hypothetical protein